MWKHLYTKICCKEAHIHHPDCVIFWVMRSYAERLYRTEAAGRKKTSSIYSCASPPLGLHVQHQSIHSREILHSQHTRKRRNKHAQYTYQRFQPVANRAVAHQASLSPFLFSLSFPLFMSLSPCVICQSLISMSWRHLYSRQTQGGMCWWLSAVAIYHLSSFCPLRR